MLYPDFEEFERLSQKGNLIPVYREILADTYTPVTAFLKLGGSPSFLLESVEGGEKWARYSFLGSRPAKILRGKGRTVEILEGENAPRIIETESPVDVIKAEITAYRPVEVKGLPRFFGGLVGYIGYDMVKFFETIELKAKDGIGFPDFFLMLTDTILVFDSLKQKIQVVSNAHVDGRDLKKIYAESVQKIDEIISRLRTPLQGAAVSATEKADGFISNIPKDGFLSAVEQAKEYVMAGDIVQVVLSQRFERSSQVDPFDIYRALRVINPSPYMYYLDIGDGKIVGSSPEILV
ncbi:MAG: chorismate-binding protein, partial [Nitrospirota bacterium]|nr:chorismate-binding protein [Nitrospirota bacterium]